MNKTTPWLLLCATLLSACGGGGGGTTTAQNSAPTISVTSQTVDEKANVTISATINDADGSVATISWAQSAGPTVSLAGAESNTVTFTAPDINAETTLTFVVTATDNLGKSSSATVAVTVTVKDVSYTVEGVVTDAPIANAVVKATLDGKTYTATANANGEYSLEIILPTAAGDELIILTATSPDSAAVLFHSILGSVADIRTAAGSDTTLTNAELFATNVTNVTSAYYALLAQANNGEVPTTKAQLSQSALNVEGELLLPFATAVKLVLDYAAGNADLALPAGFQTVAELLANRDAALEFINKSKLNTPDSYDEALAAVKADENLVKQQSDISTLAGRYYVDRTLGNLGVAQFVLNENQTGEWIQVNTEGAFTWQQTDDGIELDFGTPGLLVDTTPIYEFYYNETTTYLQTVIFRIINDADSTIQLAMDQKTLSIAGEGFNFEQLVKISGSSLKAFKQSAVVPVKEHLEINTYYALPFSGKASSFVSEALNQYDSSMRAATLKLSGDWQNGGTAFFATNDYAAPNDLVIEQGSFPWQVNSAGQAVIELSETDYVEISVLAAHVSSDTPYVSVLASIDGNKKAISYAALAQRNSNWTTQNVPGIYQLPVDPLQPNVLFWLELYADGTALTVSTGDDNNDGELSPFEANRMPGLWQLDDNGDLHVRRYRSNSGGSVYCAASQWQPTEEETCQLFNDRTMKLFNQSATQNNGSADVAVIMDHRFYDSYRRGGDTGNAQLGYDLLAYGSYYNAIWKKIAERPIAIE